MGEIRDLALDVISGDILQAAGNFSSEFRGEVKARDIHLRLFFKVMRL